MSIFSSADRKKRNFNFCLAWCEYLKSSHIQLLTSKENKVTGNTKPPHVITQMA